MLSLESMAPVREELESVQPWPGVFDQEYVRNLNGTHVKSASTKMELVEALIRDIEGFLQTHGLQRAVMVWCGSTEIFFKSGPVHHSLDAFEKGLKENAPEISPSMMYAYAAIQCGVPFANGAPNLTVDIPALLEFASKKKVPITGKDFKTGQTMMKTILAPGLKARMLGLQGWFSTNILGNRDGEVLDDPGSFRSKEVSKGSVLDAILQPDCIRTCTLTIITRFALNIILRGEMRRRGGITSTSWDGWANLCKSRSIFFVGILSLQRRFFLTLFFFSTWHNGPSCQVFKSGYPFTFKSPMARPDLKPEHDLFVQHLKLTNTIRILAKEEVLDHSGLDYYEGDPV